MTNELSEDQMVNLLRNALLAAGHDIGPVGDHWPVVNSTIYGIMSDWEDMKAKRNAFAEVKKYYAGMIDEMVTIRNGCAEDVKGEMDSTITELRAIYRACFDETAEDEVYLEDMPEHIQRAAAILDTLGEEHE